MARADGNMWTTATKIGWRYCRKAIKNDVICTGKMGLDYTNGLMDFARKCFTNGGGSGIVVFSDKQS